LGSTKLLASRRVSSWSNFITGVVRALRLSAYQEVISSVGGRFEIVKALRNGVSTGQGVSSQLGQGWVEFREGGMMSSTWITVWSESDGGRLFFQDLINGRSCQLTKQISMTREH
jgi:hypothetical protein